MNSRFASILALFVMLCGACKGGAEDKTRAADVSDTASPDLSDANPSRSETDGRDKPAPTDVSDTADLETDATDARSSPWRSRLYPEDWGPDHETESGDYLHDFSYAGYRNSEVDIGADLPANQFDVAADFGADPTGKNDSTVQVQSAIDAAADAGGGIVYFPEGTYRFDGRLNIDSSNIVLRGAGPGATKLYFTKSGGMARKSHILFGEHPETPADERFRLIDDAESRSTSVTVERSETLAALESGDDVAIGWLITDAFVKQHGMQGTWKVFNGNWEPFFLREITEIEKSEDTATLRFIVPLRYPALVRDEASVRVQTGYISEVGLEKLGIANAVGWDAAWSNDGVHAVEFRGVEDGWIREVESFEPPPASGRPTEGRGSKGHLQSGGVVIQNSKRVTVRDVVLENAQNRGGGGNGYLFEVRTSNEVLFADSVGRRGRHNFIQNWGFGVTGCVWHNVRSVEGRTWGSKSGGFKKTGHSEFHHSLATANLIDSSHIEDGWSAVNRKDMSSGAGHTATESVFWNVRGSGTLRSYQYGKGYIVGTGEDINTVTKIHEGLGGLGDFAFWEGTEPRDYTEGLGRAKTLRPQSLFDSQLAKRLE